MSGAGKWIKKHPLQAAGLIAGAAVGGPWLAGLLSPAAAAAAAPAVVGGAEGALGAAEMAMLGESAAGPLGANGLMPGLAPMATIENAAPQYAALDAGAFTPTRTSSSPFAFMDKMGKGDMFAMQQGLGLLSPDQQQMPPPMAPRPQMMAQGGMDGYLPYGDQGEEERRRRMASSGRFYG